MQARRGRRPYPGAVTPAEEKVLRLVRDGLTNGEIADRLGLTSNTVKYHVANLLAKAGVASREELRGWHAKGGRGLRLAFPALPAVPWVGLSVGAAAAVLVGLAALAIALSRTNGVAEPDVAAPVPAVVATPPAGPSLPADRVPKVETVAVFTGAADNATLSLVELQNGRTVASRPTDYNPLGTFRRTRNELLLTHRALFEGMIGREQVLEVLDLQDLSTKQVIPIPGRPEYMIGPGPAAWQTLSRDERYFAVYSYGWRDELAECQLRPADGPTCTLSSVRVLDLDSPGPNQWQFELPQHCFGGLVPHEASQFLATCDDGFYVIDVSGVAAAGPGPEPRYLTDPVVARNLASGAFWISAGAGWLGTLMTEGSFVWSRAGKPEVSNKALPRGRQVRWPIFAEIGGGRLVAGYVERYSDQYPEGLAVFDMKAGVIDRTLPGFDISRSMVAVGPDELLATTRDGRLIRIVVSTGMATTVTEFPGDPDNIALVR